MIPAFLIKLYNILECNRYCNIICWKDNDIFEIINFKLLEE